MFMHVYSTIVPEQIIAFPHPQRYLDEEQVGRVVSEGRAQFHTRSHIIPMLRAAQGGLIRDVIIHQ